MEMILFVLLCDVSADQCNTSTSNICTHNISPTVYNTDRKHLEGVLDGIPASILRKSTSGRHRPVSYPDGPMTARYRFT